MWVHIEKNLVKKAIISDKIYLVYKYHKGERAYAIDNANCSDDCSYMKRVCEDK